MQQFERVIESSEPGEAIMADAIRTLTVPLSQQGYALVSQSGFSLIYVRTYRTWVVWVLTVITMPLFGLGLLLYFSQADRAYVSVTVEERGSGSALRVFGEGTKPVTDAFASLSL